MTKEVKISDREDSIEYLRMALCMCEIGDEYINGIPYSKIVKTARKVLTSICFVRWSAVR